MDELELVRFLETRYNERVSELRELAEARTGDALPESLRGDVLLIEPAFNGADVFRELVADIEAKRLIIDSYRRELADVTAAGMGSEMRDIGFVEGLEQALRCLAVPYAGHPDYRPEWKPDA